MVTKAESQGSAQFFAKNTNTYAIDFFLAYVYD